MDNKNEQFSLIYDQYIEKIYRFVYLKVNSQESAEDITSKVFLRAWKAYSKEKSQIENMGAFLYKIAGNAVIDHYREKGRSKTISAEISPELADFRANLQDRAILNADINNIKKVIQSLKKEYQDIIIWHYLEDMPISEIAELMGKPEGTVRVMLHRGLSNLKEMIQEV
jgi:RNA polymerase sigma-70 factor (ECF subfamily)